MLPGARALALVGLAATLDAGQPLAPDVRADLEAELLALDEHERRTAQAGGSFEAWAYRYLTRHFAMAPGDFHREIYQDLQDLVNQRPIGGRHFDSVAYAYPRGHGKTTTMLGAILWMVYEWERKPHFKGEPPFILIVSDTIDQARDRARDIRDEIETNELLVADYGELAPDARERMGVATVRGGRQTRIKWTETDFTTRTGVRIKAVGSGSKVRGLLSQGRRPTMIVIDDLENDQHVETVQQRAKLLRWLTKTLIPCGIEGRLLTLMVGTILHQDSLLSKLLSKEHFRGWLKRKYAALYTDGGVPSVDGTRPLWPAQWPVPRLLARRDKIGSVAFAQEYLNQAVDETTTLFRLAWLDAARERGQGVPFLYAPSRRIPYNAVCSTWDPTELARQFGADAYQVQITAWDISLIDDEKKARQRDSDYSVGITVCVDVSDRLHVRRIYRRRGMSPGQLQARIRMEQQIIGSDFVVVENNAAQRIHEIDLTAAGLPIVPHTTTSKKHSVFEGVPGLALLFELGRIDLCAARDIERGLVDTLAAELHGLGLEAHDDLVMALWMAVVVIRRWMRRRDTLRGKLIGPPPAGYREAFPARETQRTERAAA